MSHVYVLNGELHTAEDWTADETLRLRALWDEGLSTAKIGRLMGRSKSSIVGKSHRLGLPARPSPIRGHSSKPRVRKPQPIGKLPTLPAFVRACHQCGGILGAEQSLFCTPGCAELHELALMAARKPAPKPPKEKREAPAQRQRRDRCQWIMNDSRPWQYCTNESEPGRPYCAEHCRRAYVYTPRSLLAVAA